MWRRWMVGVAVALVTTVGCGGDRALSQRQFCELVQDRVEDEFPGVMISRVDERGFDWVRGTGDRGRMSVSEEYLFYTRNPEALDELVNRLVSLLSANERLEHVGQDRDRLRRSIMPLLKPPEFMAEAEVRSQQTPLLFGEHPTGLVVFYVIDEPTAMSYMTADSLGGLGMSFRQLNQLALSNLARRTGNDRFLMDRTDDGPIAISDTRDGYDATRLISPDLLPHLSRLLDASSVVIAIPRRDLMLAVRANETALIERLRSRARREYHAGPHAITPRLFTLDREGLAYLDEE